MAAKKRFKALFAVIICCHVYAGNVHADWYSDPSVNTAICTAVNVQQDPSIISDGSGGAIIAWMDYRNGNWDIYAQRISAIGLAQWTAGGVAICTEAHDQNNSTETSQNKSTIVSDGGGGAIITWWDTRAGRSDIYAQKINASGVVQWATDGVAICTISTSLQNYQIAIVSDGSGGAIITWADLRNWHNEDKTHDIYAQRINASGVVQWATDGVAICTATNEQHFPDITSDGSGGAIITWQDDRNGPVLPWGSVNADTDIYAQRINSNGVAQWAADGVAICTATNFQLQPLIISDGSGGAIITWTDSRNGAYGDANAINDIYAQRIDANGVVQWEGDGVAVCTATNYQLFPEIISDGSGGAIVTWHDGRSGAYDIYAQRVDASGSVQWTADGVAICSAPNDQYNPRITGDGSGGAIITWWDLRSAIDIYAQRIDASGAVQWTANGVAISTEPNNQYPPKIAGDGSGGAIITWYDDRNGNWDIYAQRVNANGTLTATSSGLLAANFYGSGPWVFNLGGGTWMHINPTNAENLMYSGTTLYADFGGYGLYQWEGSVWTLLTPANPESMVVSGTTLYAGFGAYGLYQYDGTDWTLLSPSNPESMVVSGTTLYVDFGVYGLYKWDGTDWTLLSPSNPESLFVSGTTLYAGFGAYGLYQYDGTDWTLLSPSNPESMVVSGTTLYVDFGVYGLYKWDGTVWTQLTPSSPESMAVSGTTLYAGFGAYGLYKWDGTVWTLLTPASPENLVISGTSLYADLGSSGLWKLDGSSWTRLTVSNTDKMAVSN